ncbi:MAG: DNA-binding protein [Gammaproteobacteria bacterium]|nr:DNA-binding protein [Gammaproteobacteria bacterium]
MSHVISARLQDDLYFSLENIAGNRQRKLSEIIQEAISRYVEDYADYHIALDRLNDHADQLIDMNEMKRRLASE